MEGIEDETSEFTHGFHSKGFESAMGRSIAGSGGEALCDGIAEY